MSSAAGSTNRTQLERDLRENRGIDAEEQQRTWTVARRRCPFQRVDAEEAASLLGPQRGPYGAASGELYIAWAHDDVAQVMRDAEHFMKPGPGGPFSNTILAMNGEEHRKYRELVKDAFSPAAVSRWDETLIRPLMHRLIDDFVDRGRADLVVDYTSHFPFHVIRTLLGFAEEDHDRFIGLAFPHDQGEGLGGFGEAWEAALHEFLGPHVAEARSRPPGEDLLTQLVHAELDGRRLTDDELYRFLVLLIPAGADTTFAGSSTMFLGILSHPEQLEMVRMDRKLLARAADEALRWHNSAAASFLRVAIADTAVHGVAVPKGTVVAAHVSAHNRDEIRYPEPDRYDITRPVLPRGIFGYGPHACLGMHLARAEMKSALAAVLDRLPGVRLDPEAPPPYVRAGVGFPSPPSVPVVFDVPRSGV